MNKWTQSVITILRFVGDECALQKPCQNNGTCFLSQHGFRCSCTDHFKGKYCEMSSVCLPDEEWFCKANELRTDDHYDYGEKTGPEPLVLLQQGNNKQPPCKGWLVDPIHIKYCRFSANLSESAENKIVLFPKCSTTDYMVTRIKAGSMAEFSVCVWVQTADSFNFGTLCSYATSTEDNEFTITDYNGWVRMSRYRKPERERNIWQKTREGSKPVYWVVINFL